MSVLKNIPQRTCIGCNEIKNKNELIRIVKNKEGQIFVDKTYKANGRGAYICNKETCFNKCIKTKALNRVFKSEIDNEIIENLRESLK